MQGIGIVALVLFIIFVVFAVQTIKVVPQQHAWIVERLGKYAPLGKRFEPTESLKKLAAGGGRFYPLPAAASKFGG
jgi:uncharacterized membrane protein YqiK